MCKHNKVVFTGVQKTGNPDKPLLLFKCLNCGSTVTLKRISKLEIILEENKAESNKNNVKNSI